MSSDWLEHGAERARAVYWENHANLDRDHDGTACEN
ncbi:excalibur calcium-binding domain-containing protein [Nocardioides sp.]|nr:excalibur calcium-binding domain-containing protein [Nocardioides sp.]